MGLRLWQLEPGWYVLDQGIARAAEFEFQQRYDWQRSRRVKLSHRADVVYVSLPPRTTYVVDLRLDVPLDVPAAAPDLAIAARDIVCVDGIITATVHNIGSADAGNFTVTLQARNGQDWATVAEQKVKGLSTPKGFRPSTSDVVFRGCRGLAYRVVLDAEDLHYELCETNNSAILETYPQQVGLP